MEGIVCVTSHCVVFLDYIFQSGPTEAEHRKTLGEVRQRLENHGLRLKQQKGTFLQNEVMYLRHMIDRNGLPPINEKVASIQDVPIPTNVLELKSFLGMNYSRSFLPIL